MITKKRNKLFSPQVEKEDDPEKNPKINLDFLKEAEEDKKMQSKQQKNAKVFQQNKNPKKEPTQIKSKSSFFLKRILNHSG